MCDSAEAAGSYSYNGWFAKKAANAVWMGEGVRSQSVFIRDELRQYPNEIQPYSGYLLCEKGVRKMKFVMPEELREEMEDE